MNAPQTKEQTIAVIRQAKEALEKEQRSLEHVLLGAGHIVKVGPVCLDFDVVDGKALNPRNCSPDRCTRFTKVDAESIAAATVNGNGDRGIAIHINDALKESIAEHEKALGSLGA